MLKKPKEKGRRAEREVAELIKGFGFNASRTPLSGAIKGIRGLESDITSKDFPFFVEVKNRETWEVLKWYKKAEQECGAKTPLLVLTKNREDYYCFLLFSDFMRILTEKTIMKEKFKKPQKPKRLSLEETSKLKFSKKWQIRKRNETSRNA